MKTATILILTILLSPWTIHANGEAKETPAIESLKTIQMDKIDRQATEQTDVQPDTTGKHRLIQTARERGTVRIIVTYKMENFTGERHLSQGQRMAQRREIEQMHKTFVQLIESEQLKIHIGRKLELSPNIALTVDEEALRFLFNSPIIGRIDENRSGVRYLTDSTTIIGSEYINSHFDLTGKDQVIVIIDDGVDRFHPEFENSGGFGNRVTGGACFSSSDPGSDIYSLCPSGNDSETGIQAGEPCDDPELDCFHGTFVGGIAAGEQGTAPEASIISIQVFSKYEDPADCPEGAPCLRFQFSDLLAALQHVWSSTWSSQTAAVNMSLGDGVEYSSVCDNEIPAITDIINDLSFGDGISVVAASGNEGYSNGAALPACIDDVISVGSTTKQDTHSIFSNAAQYLDLVAPGDTITSAVPGDSFSDDSGTSYAAPHVAGAIALIRQANPELNANQRRTILHNTAQLVPEMFPYSYTNEHGHGRLNSRAAVIEALDQYFYAEVISSNTEYPGTHDFYNNIYILENVTLTVSGTLNLYDSDLYVLGTLTGNGYINLIGDSQIIDDYGTNNFPPENIGDGTDPPEPPIPTYTDTTFTTSTTLMETAIYTGTTTIEAGVVVTVNDGIEITMEGTVVMEESGSDYGEIYVPGFLNIDDQCQVYHGKLHAPLNGKIQLGNNVTTTSTRKKVSNGGEMLLGNNVTLKYENDTILEVDYDGLFETGSDNTMELNSQLLLIEGDAILGGGFTMKDGIMDVGETGSVEFEGSALLEFIEVPVSSMPGGPTLYIMPRMNIRGTFTSSLPQNLITMRLSPNSTHSEWNGITVFNSSEGSTLRGLTIEDAKTGIHLSSVDSVSLSNVVIDSPSEAGLVSMGSNPLASGVNITNSGGPGVDISGGNPEIGYFDAAGNSESGVRSANYASTYMPEGSVSGSGAGPSYAGVWVENASHTHFNGTIGSVSGWQAASVNGAWAYFNGTTWTGGTPYTHVDGSSQLFVYNPNNPQKAAGGQEQLQAQLLREWAERYREDRSEAVRWLMSERPSLAETQQVVASILLADHYITSREFSLAEAILTDASAKSHRDLVAPGALAQREVLLAVHGPNNKTLGRKAINALRQAENESRHLALLEDLMNQRYNEKPESEQTDQLAKTTETGELELSNYPNPFNPTTQILFTLPEQSEVSLVVYDMLGREVAQLVDDLLPAGEKTVRFDASNLANGVYIYRLQVRRSLDAGGPANQRERVRMMTLIK